MTVGKLSLYPLLHKVTAFPLEDDTPTTEAVFEFTEQRSSFALQLQNWCTDALRNCENEL